MKYKHIGIFTAVIFLVSVFGFAMAEELEREAPARKIVVFKEDISNADEAKIIARARGTRAKKLRKENLSVVYISKANEDWLARQEGVARVEEDVIVEALETGNANGQKAKNTLQAAAQVLPWGIDRIDAEKVWPLGNTGTSTNVGVIDTGISVSHPDLSVNVKGGVSEVSYTTSFNDDNGHGSHVAGIIGAVNNTIGVVGVAHSVNLYAIKVLDRKGSGFLSDVIDGIDWARLNGMKVINMSLGCDCPSQILRDAVIRARNAGVTVIAAAGNTGGAVSYPAAYPEVIAVAATDTANAVPYWSSRGPEVDIAAPGVSVYSTYKGIKYATMSGTSMAAPHVAGAAALALKSIPDTEFDSLGNCIARYDADCDGAWSPTEIQRKLEATATDFGAPGRDDIYGYGLVNAYKASMQ